MKRRPCAQCERNRAERFFVSPRGKVCADCQRQNRRATARRSHVERTYGLTAEQHQRLLEFQGGACAICQGTRPYQLAVDHDHDTGRVRGLLCKRCNRLLRDVRDNRATLRGAVEYLVLPPAVQLAIEARAR